MSGQKKEVLFSVVVPVYNGMKYLPDCVESILCQSCSDFELILVDDGSTDKSGELCEAYRNRDARVRVLHQENSGVIKARIAGLETALGKYAYLVDADDWLEPDTLEHAKDLICRYQPQLISLGRYRELPGERRYLPEPVSPGFYARDQLQKVIWPVVLMDSCMNNMYYAMGKVAERKLLLDCIRKTDSRLRLGEDTALSVWLYAMTDSVCVSDRVCYHYRVTEYSASNGFRLELFDRLEDTVQYFETLEKFPVEDLDEQLHRYVVMVLANYLLAAVHSGASHQLLQIRESMLRERFLRHMKCARVKIPSLFMGILYFLLRGGHIAAAYYFLKISRR